MRINIPKVVRPIRLSDYAPEFEDQAIGMWVNPPRDKRLEFAGITKRFAEVREQIAKTEDRDELQDLFDRINEMGLEIYAWYADMWSQGEGYEEWTGEEVKEMVEAALDTDHALWDFLQESSLDAMKEYRTRKKSD